jgi:uncharacterized membrane protein
MLAAVNFWALAHLVSNGSSPTFCYLAHFWRGGMGADFAQAPAAAANRDGRRWAVSTTSLP